jgi:medium-chain acyl-[acyl-carrier-protein] hydrolase
MSTYQLTSGDASKWLLRFPAPPTVIARLICFHWAGGNGYAFRPWNKRFQQSGVEVISMMLPGRLSRSKEPLLTNVGEITCEIAASYYICAYDDVVAILLSAMIALSLTGPNQPKTIFFGHSYGGVIAYELATRLQRESLLEVAHLIISSANNPSVLTQKSLSVDPNTKFFHKVIDSLLFVKSK